MSLHTVFRAGDVPKVPGVMVGTRSASASLAILGARLALSNPELTLPFSTEPYIGLAQFGTYRGARDALDGVVNLVAMPGSRDPDEFKSFITTADAGFGEIVLAEGDKGRKMAPAVSMLSVLRTGRIGQRTRLYSEIYKEAADKQKLTTFDRLMAMCWGTLADPKSYDDPASRERLGHALLTIDMHRILGVTLDLSKKVEPNRVEGLPMFMQDLGISNVKMPNTQGVDGSDPPKRGHWATAAALDFYHGVEALPRLAAAIPLDDPVNLDMSIPGAKDHANRYVNQVQRAALLGMALFTLPKHAYMWGVCELILQTTPGLDEALATYGTAPGLVRLAELRKKLSGLGCAKIYHESLARFGKATLPVANGNLPALIIPRMGWEVFRSMRAEAKAQPPEIISRAPLIGERLQTYELIRGLSTDKASWLGMIIEYGEALAQILEPGTAAKDNPIRFHFDLVCQLLGWRAPTVGATTLTPLDRIAVQGLGASSHAATSSMDHADMLKYPAAYAFGDPAIVKVAKIDAIKETPGLVTFPESVVDVAVPAFWTRRPPRSSVEGTSFLNPLEFQILYRRDAPKAEKANALAALSGLEVEVLPATTEHLARIAGVAVEDLEADMKSAPQSWSHIFAVGEGISTEAELLVRSPRFAEAIGANRVRLPKCTSPEYYCYSAEQLFGRLSVTGKALVTLRDGNIPSMPFDVVNTLAAEAGRAGLQA